MDFELHFILIVGACIMNFILFCISSIGFYMAIKSQEWGYFLGCIYGAIFLAVFLAWFVLVNWLSAFIK